MIEAVFVFGVVIFIGIGALMWKLPLVWRLRLLGHDLLVDLGVSVVVLWMHWGTMTGLMAATVAGLVCAVVTTITKKRIGYIRGTYYYPGSLNLASQLLPLYRKRRRAHA